MSMNRGVINGGALNDKYFHQYGSGSLISLAQDVIQYVVASGQLISISNTVQASTTVSNSLIRVAQNVIDQSLSTFLGRNGWSVDIFMGSAYIPTNQIHGPITIVKTEGDTNQAEFTIIPQRGTQMLSSFEGQTVTIIAHTAAGSKQIFTGTVETPVIDLVERKINVKCTNNRRWLINQESSLADFGYFNERVLGVPVDLADRVDKALTTVPYTLSFDSYNQLSIDYFFAKNTADYTFNAADVYRDDGRDIQVSLTPRSKMVNQVNIKYTLQKKRLYHSQTSFYWRAPYNACEMLTFNYSICPRALVQSAAEGLGWPLTGAITYEPIFPGGWYCAGGSLGFSTVVTTVTTTPKTETTLQADLSTTTANVVDAKGQQVYESRISSSVDSRDSLCLGAQWTATTQWVQDVQEEYNITMIAPASVTQFDPIPQTDTHSTSSTLNTEDWTSSKIYTPPNSTFTNVGLSFYRDDTKDASERNNALECLLHKAQTTILKSHRENKVVFNTFFAPYLEIYHTVAVAAVSSEGSEVSAKGKVYQVAHTLDPRDGSCSTKTEIRLSVMEGAQSSSTLSIPAIPTSGPAPQSVLNTIGGVTLENHFGLDPTGKDWSGFIGNKVIRETAYNLQKTDYPVSFNVKVPAIPEILTNSFTLTTAPTYNVAIVNDILEVIF